jgi:hypothetical protein
VFGIGGLLPFVGLTLLASLAPSSVRASMLVAQAGYGAVILSFVGALHWAFAMRSNSVGGAAWRRYGASVLPAIAGWLTLQAPVSTGLRIEAALLVVFLVVERRWLAEPLLAEWYAPLRGLLTAVAATALLVSSSF